MSDSPRKPDRKAPSTDASVEARRTQTLTALLAAHDKRLQRVEAQVLAPAADAAKNVRGAPWNLTGLTRAESEQTWRDLEDWLRERVHDLALEREVPRCWYRHRGLVAQLAALKSWHEAAHGPHARPADAVAWYEAFLRTAEHVWPRYRGHNHTAEVPAASRRQHEREEVEAAEFERYITEDL